jgi:hypothetical protein
MIQGSLGFCSRLSKPVLKLMTPGLPVAAWFKDEYHRGVIMKAEPEEQFKVFLVDYGDEVSLPYSEFRYLLKELCSFPIQAIRCRLLVKGGRRQGSVRSRWTPMQTEAFLETVFDQPLKIEFQDKRKSGVSIVVSLGKIRPSNRMMLVLI